MHDLILDQVPEGLMQVETGHASSAAGQAARAVMVEREQLGTQLGEIGLQRRAPVLVLVGGADGMDAGAIADLEHLFMQAIAPIASALGAYVVDGGTDTGVMRLMGRARAALGAQFPLIGVIPRDALNVTSSTGTGHRPQIEPHHSHVVLVPEASWQAAGPWMNWVAEELAGGFPSVTLLINGGDVSWDDVLRSVRDRRPVIAVSGSGRAADALAAALGGESSDPRAHEVLASGLVEAVSVADGPAILSRRLGSHLTATAAATASEQLAQEHDALERKDLEGLIEDLDLSALQKHFLRSRWLDQTMWMSRKAAQAQKRYYTLRLIVIIGSIAIPMLVGFASNNDDRWRALTTITSSIVAISAAVEEFFHYGERWQQYRQTAERLKLEGWRFFQRTGPYQRFASHGLAYREFAGCVERLIEDDVNVYVSEIISDRKRDGSPPVKPAKSDASS